jgi:hypothetical protein
MVPEDETALPPEAQEAWFAYRAMCASKRDYFALLSELENRYQDSGAGPSEEENSRLAALLSRHDENVKAFNAAMAAISEPASRQALLVRLQADKSSEE